MSKHKHAATKTPEVKVAAPAPAKPEAVTTPAPKPSRAVKYISREPVPAFNRRMRVAEYQDYTFSVNGTRKLTDEELAADWHAQFPAAVAFTAFHVKGARRDYNAGVHSKTFNKRPESPAVEYVIVNGERVVAGSVKVEKPVKAAPAAKAAQPTAPAQPAPKASVKVKKHAA